MSEVPDWFLGIMVLVALSAELAKLEGIDLNELHPQQVMYP